MLVVYSLIRNGQLDMACLYVYELISENRRKAVEDEFAGSDDEDEADD